MDIRLAVPRKPGAALLLEVLAEPFNVLAIDGRDDFGAGGAGSAAGAMESRLVFWPAADGFGVLEGVELCEALADDPVELSCFVGDLLGDYIH